MRGKKNTKLLSTLGIERTAVLILICSISVTGLHARLRFIGPNPYYSFLTFPQDSRLFKGNASLLFLYYRSRGWMGHLDSPEISPSPQYIASEESVQENFYATKTAEAEFKGKWYTPEILTVPFVLDYKSIRIIPMISGQLDIFNLRASGEAISHGEESNSLIPFSSNLSQQNSEFSLGLVASISIKNMPIGMIFNYKHHSENSPSGSLNFNKDGLETNLNRFNWGWSTISGCNHIFGTSTNIDAFWQDQYTNSKKSQLDFVVGTDIKENKLGFRFRKITEYGDNYSYSAPLNQYVKNDSREKTSKTALRAYDVIKILNIGDAKLYLCGVLETDLIRKKYVKEGIELLDSYKENAYALEFLPFIHFDLNGGGFLRIGSSASFFWNDYSYLDFWGEQEVYSPSWAHFGWERSWEKSSRGNSFSFINFSEANLEIPAFKKWNLLLSIDIWSHQVHRKTKRYYGKNVKNQSIYEFHKTAERKNILKESWFGGTFGLLFGHRLSIGMFIDLPVYYDKSISTEIRGDEGDFFRGKSDAQPAIRTPVGFWTMVIMRW